MFSRNNQRKFTRKRRFGPIPRRRTGPGMSLWSPRRFRLVDNSTSGIVLNSTVGGVMAGAFNCDPSGSGSWTASEWSALTTLYSEVKVIWFKVTFNIAPQSDSKIDGTAPGNSLYVSAVMSNIGATPTSSAQVYDNAGAKVYQVFHTRGMPVSHKLRQRDLNYAIVTTPSPGSYAGCSGGIQWWMDQLPVSVTIGYAKIEGVYEFRSRI